MRIDFYYTFLYLATVYHVKADIKFWFLRIVTLLSLNITNHIPMCQFIMNIKEKLEIRLAWPVIHQT